jgi:methylated-DNA-[protein]-cysteine S-methyltransferase
LKTSAQGAEKSRRKNLKYLTFGHASAEAALGAVPSGLADKGRVGGWNPHLVGRLQAYALGGRDDFLDVEVDLETRTEFQRRILRLCRQIPFGQTRTYAQLAAQAGCPRAARAVGNCMAANPIPLVIPCHRVVASGGGLGGYSALGGLRMKRRLLALEAGQAAD